MLKAFVCDGSRMRDVALPESTGAAIGEFGEHIIWYDLVSPDEDERARVEKITGLSLPSQADIVEIENSSRLSVEEEVLTLTIPLPLRMEEGMQASAAGFVLSATYLVTLRYASGLVFDKFPSQAHEVGKPGSHHAAYVFAGLLEAITDRQADALEQLRADLDGTSRDVFRRARGRSGSRREKDEETKLTNLLSKIGLVYDHLSLLRDSQLGVGRIAGYAPDAVDWLPDRVCRRLKTVQNDIASLNEFNTHLAEKVQFLLDATLGLISVAQNRLMKVFTIVAVVGIPPTVIAGIYGMNFHDMPELSWHYGYFYGLSVILLSAFLPVIWFKVRGWL